MRQALTPCESLPLVAAGGCCLFYLELLTSWFFIFKIAVLKIWEKLLGPAKCSREAVGDPGEGIHAQSWLSEQGRNAHKYRENEVS